MKVKIHKNDLPNNLNLGKIIAIDTETMGLDYKRDPLCLVQISSGNEEVHLIQINRKTFKADNLKKIVILPRRNGRVVDRGSLENC